MTSVREVKVRAVQVPMPEPHRTASGVIVNSPLVLVDVDTSEGATGHAMLFTYTLAALRPLCELTSNIADLAVGKPLAPAQLTQELLSRFRLLGTQGLVGMAIAGLDMACWDALAKIHGLPLARLLGAEEQAIRAYGAVGYDGPLESARVAERWAKAGFGAVKAKIGYPTVVEDREVLQAIRSAVGGSVEVMADYNQCLTVPEAVVRLRRLEDLGLAWVEEPTFAPTIVGTRKSRGRFRPRSRQARIGGVRSTCGTPSMRAQPISSCPKR